MFCQCHMTQWITPVCRTYYCAPGRGAEYCNECVFCLSVCLHSSQEWRIQTSPNFLSMLPVAMAQSSSGNIAPCRILPVLWMTIFSYNGLMVVLAASHGRWQSVPRVDETIMQGMLGAGTLLGLDLVLTVKSENVTIEIKKSVRKWTAGDEKTGKQTGEEGKKEWKKLGKLA